MPPAGAAVRSRVPATKMRKPAVFSAAPAAMVRFA
jgi:hypothetical protein